jgi:hypothetical protein
MEPQMNADKTIPSYPCSSVFLGGYLAALLLTTGCGYVGGPLVPLANVPAPVSDLAAVQRGPVLIVHCTVPTRTTESVLIKTPVRLDLHIGAVADEHFNSEEWASHAKAVSGAEVHDGLATYRIPVAEWVGQQLAFGVRATGSNGKHDGWSNYQIVKVVAPPEVPSRPTLENVAAGVRVTWSARGDQFRILRRAGKDENFSVVATLAAHDWTDAATEYGTSYTYMLQALIDLGGQKVAESDLSETATITPVDKFPPAVPSGLRVVTGLNSVELVWERNTEADLAFYRVYRALGDGPWEKLAESNAIPSYSDAAVEHGKTYRYAISAVDKAGNESARSTPSVVVVP